MEGGMNPVRPHILQEKNADSYNWFYTYVLISEKDGNLYTGATNDLTKRIGQHKNGLVGSTKYRFPIKLVYFEACLNKPRKTFGLLRGKDDAFRPERHLK